MGQTQFNSFQSYKQNKVDCPKYGPEKNRWDGNIAITPENLWQLYQPMPRRMQAIIDAGGAHTRH